MDPSITGQQPSQQPALPHDPSIVYLQPGQRAVYIQPGMTPPPQYPQAPAAPAAPWFYANQYTPQPPAQSSGLRIAAGVIGIALGAWSLLAFFVIMANTFGPSTPLFGWLNFLYLVGAIAILTLGIMVIVKHRQRSKPIPAMLLGSAAVTMILALVLADAYWLPGLRYSLLGGIPLIVLAILALIIEASAAESSN